MDFKFWGEWVGSALSSGNLFSIRLGLAECRSFEWGTFILNAAPVVENQRYVFLDGSRGVAAICVMIGHITQRFGPHIFQSKILAVDFFFMLSGFVLCRTYSGRPNLTAERFLMQRLVRLYPNFAFGLILGLPIFLYMSKIGMTEFPYKSIISSFALNMLYIPYFNQYKIFNPDGTSAPGPIFPINDPSWSLFFELLANIFFIFFATKSNRYMILSVSLSLAMLVYIGFFDSLQFGRIGVSFSGGPLSETIVEGFPRVFYNFLAGMLLARFESFEFISKYSRFIAVSALIVIAAIFSVPEFKRGGSIYYLINIVVVFPSLIYFGAKLNVGRGVLDQIFKFLGWISYPLYCLHFPIMRFVQIFAKTHSLGGISPLLLISISSIFLSIFVCKFMDEPLRKFLQKRMSFIIQKIY